MIRKIKLFTASLSAALSLSSCATITPVGDLGPKKLGVYSISHNDFLSASRMLVILDKKGNLVAYTGGTVSGAGTVGLQTGATLATAGAIVYSAKAIESAAQHANVNVKGIPSNINVHTTSEFHIKS